jgi:methylenetetrahydrofolate reductase (NADPH)
LKIYMELVPRDKETLLTDVRKVAEKLRRIDAITIPELETYEIRSLAACGIVRTVFPRAVPCFRALEFDPQELLPMAFQLVEKGFEEVIVISGESPHGLFGQEQPSGLLGVIRKFKKEVPGLKVYAGFDPYRQGLQKEMDYAKMKLDAGADGFFTQPFFSLELMEKYLELLEPYEVFWGLSPVLTTESRNYWEARNHAVFPADFQPTLGWNRELFMIALEEISKHDGNACFMPIKAPILECFEGIL